MRVSLLSKHPLSSHLVAFILGSIFVATIAIAYAESNVINACIGPLGGVRIITGTQHCTQAERPISWNQQGPVGPQGPQGPQGPAGTGGYFGLPFICDRCFLSPYAAQFADQNFSNAQIYVTDFSNADIHGVILSGGYIDSSNFSNSNLTGANLSSMHYLSDSGGLFANFTNANLTSANLSNNNLSSPVKFNNANLQNANFSNDNINNADFTGATNMSTANITGVTWTNVICPDGTNSDNNGNTCVGHF